MSSVRCRWGVALVSVHCYNYVLSDIQIGIDTASQLIHIRMVFQRLVLPRRRGCVVPQQVHSLHPPSKRSRIRQTSTFVREADCRCRNGRRLCCSKCMCRYASDYAFWHRTSVPYEYGPNSLRRAVRHRPRREDVRLYGAFPLHVERKNEHVHCLPLLMMYNSWKGDLESMAFTAGLGAQDARLTCKQW